MEFVSRQLLYWIAGRPLVPHKEVDEYQIAIRLVLYSLDDLLHDPLHWTQVEPLHLSVHRSGSEVSRQFQIVAVEHISSRVTVFV